MKWKIVEIGEVICSITEENLAEYISQEVWLSSVKLKNK